MIENLDFGRSGLNSRVFEKLFISYLCILFIIQCVLRSFCIKMLCFFKKLIFPNFQSIEPVSWSIEIAIKILVWPAFFMHHFYLGFTCIALFLYPSCSFIVISLIVFTQNMHALCYIGYSTWSKNCLINFWAIYFLVYAFFMCELQKIFFLRDMMDNQYANIFSTHATVYGSHSAMFAFYWKREYFFFMYILNLIFLSLVCVFLYIPTPLYFSRKLFFLKLVLFFLFL